MSESNRIIPVTRLDRLSERIAKLELARKIDKAEWELLFRRTDEIEEYLESWRSTK